MRLFSVEFADILESFDTKILLNGFLSMCHLIRGIIYFWRSPTSTIYFSVLVSLSFCFYLLLLLSLSLFSVFLFFHFLLFISFLFKRRYVSDIYNVLTRTTPKRAHTTTPNTQSCHGLISGI